MVHGSLWSMRQWCAMAAAALLPAQVQAPGCLQATMIVHENNRTHVPSKWYEQSTELLSLCYPCMLIVSCTQPGACNSPLGCEGCALVYLKGFLMLPQGALSLPSPLPAIGKEWCLLNCNSEVVHSTCKGQTSQELTYAVAAGLSCWNVHAQHVQSSHHTTRILTHTLNISHPN